jgi:hypothetical protein
VIRVEVVPAYAPETERIWRSLEEVARPGYFLSWGWVENLLACLPRSEVPRLAIFRDGAAPIAACLLGQRWILRHGVLPSRAVFLNATGLPARDDLTIEHNGFLQRPGTQISLARLVDLLPRDWDEIFLPAVDADAFASLEVDHHTVLVDKEVPAPFVDLAAVRAAGDYLALISHKTRGQIRRARRELGSLTTEVAADLPTAFSIYDELVTLHTAQWHAKGQPGAFADPWIDHFHRRLRSSCSACVRARKRSGAPTAWSRTAASTSISRGSPGSTILTSSRALSATRPVSNTMLLPATRSTIRSAVTRATRSRCRPARSSSCG